MPKPHIDDVSEAFARFISSSVVAVNRHITEPKKYEAVMGEARLELKTKLTELGLAEHIDWTRPDK